MSLISDLANCNEMISIIMMTFGQMIEMTDDSMTRSECNVLFMVRESYAILSLLASRSLIVGT